MRITGKNIFTLASINAGKPQLKEDIAEWAEKIAEQMKEFGITKIEEK